MSAAMRPADVADLQDAADALEIPISRKMLVLPCRPKRWGELTRQRVSSPFTVIEVTVPHLTYIVLCGDFVKIGCSCDPDRRLRDLSAANPYPMSIILVFDGGREVEQLLHDHFKAHRHRGEWFHLSEPIRQFIIEHGGTLP